MTHRLLTSESGDRCILCFVYTVVHWGTDVYLHNDSDVDIGNHANISIQKQHYIMYLLLASDSQNR